jgi:hypothetical protein
LAHLPIAVAAVLCLARHSIAVVVLHLVEAYSTRLPIAVAAAPRLARRPIAVAAVPYSARHPIAVAVLRLVGAYSIHLPIAVAAAVRERSNPSSTDRYDIAERHNSAYHHRVAIQASLLLDIRVRRPLRALLLAERDPNCFPLSD